MPNSSAYWYGAWRKGVHDAPEEQIRAGLTNCWHPSPKICCNGDPQHFQDNSIRVERILLEMVRPDPVQPRRVLPEQLHIAFHNSRLTPT